MGMGKTLSSHNSLALEPIEALLFKNFLKFEGLYGNINLFCSSAFVTERIQG